MGDEGTGGKAGRLIILKARTASRHEIDERTRSPRKAKGGKETKERQHAQGYSGMEQ